MPTQSTLQHVYATNLTQKYGYPLRNPQPDSELPDTYKTDGLQIGDIGHVDHYGKFNLFFNIKFPPDHLSKWKFPPSPSPESGGGPGHPVAHESTSEQPRDTSSLPEPLPVALDLARFDGPKLISALDPNQVIMTGVTQDGVGDSRASKDYVFTAESKEGAILILPDGAKLSEMEKKYSEHIQDHITKYAPDWCNRAKRDSLYLVTAVYKTKSWTLGSFDHGASGKKIHVYPEDDSAPVAFRWVSAFHTDSQQAPKGNNHLNQAVFIKGFKITVRDEKLLNLECLERPEGWFAHILNKLRLKARKFLSGSSTTIDHFPQLDFSEPTHPLDIVNRVLLDENPGADLAVTHDNDWINIVKDGRLRLDNLMKEGPLWDCIAKSYKRDLDIKHNIVCLRPISPSESKTGEETALLSHGRCEVETGGKDEPNDLEHPEVSQDNSRLVITYMRLESFDVDQVDVGVCVFIKFGNTTWRTPNKPHANVVEWDDVVTLPSEGPAHVTVCGTFQLGSTLGTREISQKQTIGTSDMSRRISPGNLRFFFGPRSSLLITLERHFSNFGTHFSDEENSEFSQTTTRGFENFYSYHRSREKERLDTALECFRSALQKCGLDDARLATARFNIATTEFLRCQARGTYAELDKVTKLYKETLHAYADGHPDRPATLLLLAQALLSRHGKVHDEFALENIEQLLVELPPDGSRYHRSADAILATCRFYRAINAVDPVQIDGHGLLTELKRGVYTPPYGYVDQPHLSHKLGVAFWRRFRSTGNLDDLDKSIELNMEALLQVPDGHDDKKHIAACLASSFLFGLEGRGELTDVVTSVRLVELGNKVTAMLDVISYTEGASAPSEDLQKQIDLKFAMARLRGQIQLMSRVEKLLEQAATGDTHQNIVEQGPSSHAPEVKYPAIDWTRDEDTLTECKGRLGVLLSFLGGEGDRKMRQALQGVHPEWSYRDHKIVATMQALEERMPSFFIILARRLRFVMKGWS
ncbi:hypothetical protein JVU11DRAFT_11829 [Chiua virens]|nr:hypothetical protein JVU11DRAFT_11829 [Chiua virens]